MSELPLYTVNPNATGLTVRGYIRDADRDTASVHRTALPEKERLSYLIIDN